MLETCLENVRATCPLVHSITNYVTVNDCANVLLAAGASPIMSDDAGEVEEITALCRATVLNIGTLNERTIQSMLLAGQKANALSHPVVLDPVGAGASALRTSTCRLLLREINFSVIRGNISEIKALALGSGSTQGVDASITDQITEKNLAEAVAYIRAFSQQAGAIIAVSGAIDIVSNATKSYIIKNGHPDMSKITGSGCMLSALVAAYLAANPTNPLEATATAFVLMGLAGEKAAIDFHGTGSFRVNLIDAISYITAQELKAGAKIVEF